MCPKKAPPVGSLLSAPSRHCGVSRGLTWSGVAGLGEGGTEVWGTPGQGERLRLGGADRVGISPKAAQPAAEPRLIT